MNEQAIGVFDSGLGGLSVWRELHRQLPHESVIYLADSAYCPYGSRSAEAVYHLSDRIVRFLRERRCKLIVVACNTATAAAIGQLRAKHDLLFVGMEPALKPAAQATRSGVIGILATHGTFQGSHFHHTRAAHAQGVEVLIEEGQGLVELVERGETASPEAYHLLRRYLTPMVQAGADQIVLGCSHYPFLTQTMQDILGTRAQVVDPAPAVARQVARLLQQENLTCQETATASYHFYTTGTLNQLQRMVRDLVRPEIYDSCHFARVHLPMIDA